MSTEATAVRDVVITLENYPHLKEDEPLSNAVGLLLSEVNGNSQKACFDEILVIDANNRLCGRLSTVDILASFFPSLNTSAGKSYIGTSNTFADLSILMEESFRKECRRQSAELVKNHMRPPHKAIDGAMHVLHAAEIMIKDKECLLPVTENNKLLGVVRFADIFRVLGTFCAL